MGKKENITVIFPEKLMMLFNYFSIFKYPLTLNEIYNLTDTNQDKDELNRQLTDLVRENIIHSSQGFYFLDKDNSCVTNRLEGEKRATLLFPKAIKTGRFIALFPFVKFVGISGSLSKGFASEKSDFDYFIITANNTLWICRTILHLFKKITFIFGLQHRFCMNYFIDANHLEIEEKNMFTQIELMTLVPLNNYNMYQYFMLKNSVPNIDKIKLNVPKDSFVTAYDHIHKKERNKWLKPLNIFLMKLTDTKWKKKWRKKNFPEKEYDLCFKTTPYVSKNHPKNYQKRVLDYLNKLH